MEGKIHMNKTASAEDYLPPRIVEQTLANEPSGCLHSFHLRGSTNQKAYYCLVFWESPQSLDDVTPLFKSPINYPEKITLITSDKKKMAVDFSFLKDSKIISTIENLICKDMKELVVPLHEEFATEAALRKAFEWMEANAAIELKPEELESKIKLDKKQTELFAQLDIDQHIALILAANYLNTPPLLHYSLQALADKMSAMNLDTLRSSFSIPAPSPEEDKALRTKFAWALEEPSKKSK